MGDDDEKGSLSVNPIILMPTNDYVKLAIYARFLNSVTDLTIYSWPLEPVQMIMTRVSGKFFYRQWFILRMPSSTTEF